MDEYHYDKLKDISPKIKQGLYKLHNTIQLVQDNRPTATYKDYEYRNHVAQRFGMFILQNNMGFCTPYLLESWKPEGEKNGKEERCVA